MTQELLELSKRYGKNEDYVLAGGGNTSYKNDDCLFIKASGKALATITENEFVKLNRNKLSKIWGKAYPEDVKQREAAVLSDLMAAREAGEEDKRPSVETLLHDLLPHAYVVHLHPAVVNGLTCSRAGKEYASRLFGNTFLWIDPIEPGYRLAKKVREELFRYKRENYKSCQIVFLGNHGVFVSADNAEDIDRIYSEITEKIDSELMDKPDFSSVKADREKENKIISLIAARNHSSVICLSNKTLEGILRNRTEFLSSCAFTPDHIVYCKANSLVLKNEEDILIAMADYQEKYGFAPRIIVLLDTGVFICGENKETAEIIKKLYLDMLKIAVYANSFGGLNLMPESLVNFIVNWEAESYRAKTSMGGKL